MESNFKKVFNLALHELGLNEEDLLLLAKLQTNTELDLENIYQTMDTKLFMEICSILCLDLNMFSQKYNKFDHRLAVGKAVHNKTFILPLTKEVDEIYKEFLKNLNVF